MADSLEEQNHEDVVGIKSSSRRLFLWLAIGGAALVGAAVVTTAIVLAVTGDPDTQPSVAPSTTEELITVTTEEPTTTGLTLFNLD